MALQDQMGILVSPETLVHPVSRGRQDLKAVKEQRERQALLDKLVPLEQMETQEVLDLQVQADLWEMLVNLALPAPMEPLVKQETQDLLGLMGSQVFVVKLDPQVPKGSKGQVDPKVKLD